MAVTKITLTLTTAPAATPLATVGAMLAARLGAALEAVLFEDRQLLRLAESRLLWRVRMPSGEREAPSAADLADELRLHTEQLRRAVAAAARAAGIDASFQVLDEPADDMPLPIAGEIVVVSQDGLLGHRRALVRRLLRDAAGLLLLPTTPVRLGRAAVLLGPAAGKSFVAAAMDVARRLGADAIVDVVALAAGADAGDVPAGVPPQSRVHHLAQLDPLEAWPDALPHAIDMLIMSSADLPQSPPALDALLEDPRRPLLVLRDRHG